MNKLATWLVTGALVLSACHKVPINEGSSSGAGSSSGGAASSGAGSSSGGAASSGDGSSSGGAASSGAGSSSGTGSAPHASLRAVNANNDDHQTAIDLCAGDSSGLSVVIHNVAYTSVSDIIDVPLTTTHLRAVSSGSGCDTALNGFDLTALDLSAADNLFTAVATTDNSTSALILAHNTAPDPAHTSVAAVNASDESDFDIGNALPSFGIAPAMDAFTSVTTSLMAQLPGTALDVGEGFSVNVNPDGKALQIGSRVTIVAFAAGVLVCDDRVIAHCHLSEGAGEVAYLRIANMTTTDTTFGTVNVCVTSQNPDSAFADGLLFPAVPVSGASAFVAMRGQTACDVKILPASVSDCTSAAIASLASLTLNSGTLTTIVIGDGDGATPATGTYSFSLGSLIDGSVGLTTYMTYEPTSGAFDILVPDFGGLQLGPPLTPLGSGQRLILRDDVVAALAGHVLRVVKDDGSTIPTEVWEGDFTIALPSLVGPLLTTFVIGKDAPRLVICNDDNLLDADSHSLCGPLQAKLATTPATGDKLAYFRFVNFTGSTVDLCVDDVKVSGGSAVATNTATGFLSFPRTESNPIFSYVSHASGSTPTPCDQVHSLQLNGFSSASPTYVTLIVDASQNFYDTPPSAPAVPDLNKFASQVMDVWQNGDITLTLGSTVVFSNASAAIGETKTVTADAPTSSGIFTLTGVSTAMYPALPDALVPASPYTYFGALLPPVSPATAPRVLWCDNQLLDATGNDVCALLPAN